MIILLIMHLFIILMIPAIDSIGGSTVTDYMGDSSD